MQLKTSTSTNIHSPPFYSNQPSYPSSQNYHPQTQYPNQSQHSSNSWNNQNQHSYNNPNHQSGIRQEESMRKSEGELGMSRADSQFSQGKKKIVNFYEEVAYKIAPAG